ncbi:hypothetical protein ACF0H5_015623 [Mactra antiquata]
MYVLLLQLLNGIEPFIGGHLQNPRWQNRVHVVCFILDDKSFERSKVEANMIQNVISEILTPKGIAFIVVVTKLDKCHSNRDDVIEKTAQVFNLISGKIHAIQNYVDEKQTSADMDIPIIGKYLHTLCDYEYTYPTLTMA